MIVKMSNYYLKCPTVIAFSGGRTSGFMLAKILEAHSGKLPDYVKVCFCNTGLEHSKTYDFIERFSLEFNVDIVWLEYVGKQNENKFKVVNYANASRNGEPFSILVEERKYLPNPVARFCTVELKIRTMDRWSKKLGGEFAQKHDECIGLRYDEPRRVANIKATSRRNFARCPIYDAKHTLEDVSRFWKNQSFDLGIPQHQGNCQGRFLKSRYRLDLVARETPESFRWWIEQEKKIVGSEIAKKRTFRSDRPTYLKMLQESKDQKVLFPDFDNTVSCHCTD
jgi:3'-phosphoadenosine 5'-phosphosulfate sulfotransferase (PAPS reductase)/FAD synthetase